MKIYISIIVPIYNAELYITRCIRSIISQSYPFFELILIDDGSIDNSRQICEEFANEDSRVSYFYQDNQGVSAARNRGLMYAHGEWVMFVDADDWIEMETLQLSIPYLTKDFDLVIFGLHEDWENEKVELPQKYESSDLQSLKELIPFLDKRCLLQGPVCKFFHRRLLCELDLKFDITLSYGEDSKFTFSYLMNVNSIGFINRILYHYFRRRGDNLSFKKYNYEQWLTINKMLFNLRMQVLKKFRIGLDYKKNIIGVYWIHYSKALLSMYDSQTMKKASFRYNAIKNIKYDEILKEYIPDNLFYKLLFYFSKSSLLCDIYLYCYNKIEACKK